MSNGVWTWLLVLMLCSGAAAQEDAPQGEKPEEQVEKDSEAAAARKAIEREVERWFSVMDADGNGVISLSELKAHALKVSGAESDKSMEFLPYYGLSLAWFLAADKSRNQEVSKAELVELLTRREQEEGFKPELTEDDIKKLEAEYFGPMADAIIKLADGDGDGQVSRAEADAMDGAGIDDEEWNKLDTNRDGKIGREELIAGFRVELAEDYKLPGAEKPANELYREGRAWLTRTESVEDGKTEISHERTEVLKVEGDRATLRTTLLDTEMKPVGEPRERASEVPAPVEPRGKRETITVKAGEFECTLSETAAGGTVLQVWESVRYGGLTVRSFVQIGGRRTTIELIEFK